MFRMLIKLFLAKKAYDVLSRQYATHRAAHR
jgi:hypothetical protein